MSEDLPGSCSFEHALWHAAWFARYALDVAPEYGVHPGAVAHLKAASVQLTAVERLYGSAILNAGG